MNGTDPTGMGECSMEPELCGGQGGNPGAGEPGHGNGDEDAQSQGEDNASDYSHPCDDVSPPGYCYNGIDITLVSGSFTVASDCRGQSYKTVTALIVKITWRVDCDGSWHPEAIGSGLGVPSVSSTYSQGGDSCIALEGDIGVGPVTGGTNVGLDAEGTGSASINEGVSISPFLFSGGLFVTVGSC